jgi:hypothetical protein
MPVVVNVCPRLAVALGPRAPLVSCHLTMVSLAGIGRGQFPMGVGSKLKGSGASQQNPTRKRPPQ